MTGKLVCEEADANCKGRRHRCVLCQQAYCSYHGEFALCDFSSRDDDCLIRAVADGGIPRAKKSHRGLVCEGCYGALEPVPDEDWPKEEA